jgi:opacity protein-like surface antigen
MPRYLFALPLLAATTSAHALDVVAEHLVTPQELETQTTEIQQVYQEPPAPVYATAYPVRQGYLPGPVWAGPYVGVQGVYQSGGTDQNHGGYFHSSSNKDNGTGAGAHLGYSYQNGRIVIGPELDVERPDTTASDSSKHNHNAQATVDWQGSARLRAGVLVHPRMLVYATGGWEVADAKITSPNNFFKPAKTEHNVLNGPTYGGGVELALLDRTSVRAEYRHTDFNKVSVSDGWGGNTDVKHKDDDFRLGLTYHFAPPPAY